MSSEENHPVVDVAIIGGGPTGLFAAFYAGLRKMSVNILDSLDALGGQLSTLYPEKYVYDVGGFPKILAKDLAKNLIEQAMQYTPTVSLGEQVERLDYDEASKTFHLKTPTLTHRARTVVISAGMGAFAPKMLTESSSQRFHGKGLEYFVKHPKHMAEKRVLIVGGGDSAVDWANALSPLASSVSLIHRRDQFRAHEESVAKMKQGTTRIKTFFELKELVGIERVEKAIIYDNRTNEVETLEVDVVLVNIGFNNTLGPIKEWGLEIEHGSIKVDSMMQTCRPGVFAAGDITAFPGKLKLIATGFGEACVAVNYAKHFIDPKANIFPGHSSNMKR